MDELIDQWQKKGWIGAVRRLNEKNMELRKSLSKEIRFFRQTGVKVEKAELSNLWALFTFRLLIQIANLFFSHRLGGLLRRLT